MSRVAMIDPKIATGETKTLLDAVQSRLGMVPNFIRVLAISPSALQAYLGLHGIAGVGVLDPKTRERIALSVAEQNARQYCVLAHTAIGRKVGLDSHEMLANRTGRSADAKAEAALIFARRWSRTWARSRRRNSTRCDAPATPTLRSSRSSPMSP